MEDLDQQLIEAEENLLSLSNVLFNLRREVDDPIFTQSGEKFFGTLEFEKEVLRASSELNRFKRETQYVIEFGGEYNGILQDVVITLRDYEAKQKLASRNEHTHH